MVRSSNFSFLAEHDDFFVEIATAAEAATWRTPDDIRIRYSRSSILSDNRVVFRLKGNDYRLLVKVRYRNGIVMIEWVGTHAEYDKLSF